MKTFLVILALIATALLVSPTPATCNACVGNPCMNDSQCGVTCACVIPYFRRLGSCLQVRR